MREYHKGTGAKRHKIAVNATGETIINPYHKSGGFTDSELEFELKELFGTLDAVSILARCSLLAC